MALGFSRLVCIEVLYVSIPSARYTDKADGHSAGREIIRCVPGNAQRSVAKKGDGDAAIPMSCSLPRVELHDQRFLDVGTELVAIGRLLEGALELRSVDR